MAYYGIMAHVPRFPSDEVESMSFKFFELYLALFHYHIISVLDISSDQRQSVSFWL